MAKKSAYELVTWTKTRTFKKLNLKHKYITLSRTIIDRNSHIEVIRAYIQVDKFPLYKFTPPQKILLSSSSSISSIIKGVPYKLRKKKKKKVNNYLKTWKQKLNHSSKTRKTSLNAKSSTSISPL